MHIVLCVNMSEAEKLYFDGQRVLGEHDYVMKFGPITPTGAFNAYGPIHFPKRGH